MQSETIMLSVLYFIIHRKEPARRIHQRHGEIRNHIQSRYDEEAKRDPAEHAENQLYQRSAVTE